jgi:hypothetical protein
MLPSTRRAELSMFAHADRCPKWPGPAGLPACALLSSVPRPCDLYAHARDGQSVSCRIGPCVRRSLTRAAVIGEPTPCAWIFGASSGKVPTASDRIPGKCNSPARVRIDRRIRVYRKASIGGRRSTGSVPWEMSRSFVRNVRRIQESGASYGCASMPPRSVAPGGGAYQPVKPDLFQQRRDCDAYQATVP